MRAGPPRYASRSFPLLKRGEFSLTGLSCSDEEKAEEGKRAEELFRRAGISQATVYMYGWLSLCKVISAVD